MASSRMIPCCKPRKRGHPRCRLNARFGSTTSELWVTRRERQSLAYSKPANNRKHQVSAKIQNRPRSNNPNTLYKQLTNRDSSLRSSTAGRRSSSRTARLPFSRKRGPTIPQSRSGSPTVEMHRHSIAKSARHTISSAGRCSKVTHSDLTSPLAPTLEELRSQSS